MSGPVVSIVIPAYNAAWCVGRAIDSVLGQTFTDFELIIVDDGSSDDLAQALSPYGTRVRLIAKQNGGLSSARNAGIHAAKGRYVAFLDADDWWMPEKLAHQLAWMQTHEDAVFCSTAARVVDPQGEMIGEWRCGSCPNGTLEAIFSTNAHVAGSGSAVLARRRALLDAGGFDECLRGLEDVDMWMRLSIQGRYLCIDEPLVVILKRRESVSRNLDIMRNAAITVMRKNRHLLPAHKQGAFWRNAYGGMLADYAKWEYRDGRTWQAVRHLMEVLFMAPVGRGRLALGLLAAIARGIPF
jgi:glycosyltransferase involved in cell wall biosynthesis